MDIDVTYAEIGELVEEAKTTASIIRQAEIATELVAKWGQLDDWLIRAGTLPEAWTIEFRRHIEELRSR